MSDSAIRQPDPEMSYAMIPDEHRPAVEEVIRFVTEGRILSEPFRREQFHDFPCEVVYDTCDWTPYRAAGRLNSKCEVSWQDILVSSYNDFSRLEDPLVEEYPFIRSGELTDALNEIYLFLRPIIEERFAGVLPKNDIAEIDLHIDLLVGTRARVGGGNDHLIEEKFFNAYKAGGYPCGWIGRFPDGKLLVFSR